MPLHRSHRLLEITGFCLVGFSALFALGIIWYQGPSSLILRLVFQSAWLGLTGLSLYRFFQGRSAAWLFVYGLPFAILMSWFSSIQPSNDRIWSAEMAKSATYERSGDIITVSNVRNFLWTGPSTSDENWETRSYDLNAISSVDVLSLYWKGPRVAHTYFSFVWNSGEALSISVEIRKEKNEAYSAIGGFFKAFELAVLAGDERDFYGWRVFFPTEDIQLYRTRANARQARTLLLALLDSANKVSARPVFYNTLTENCTTEVWMLTQAMGKGTPHDWRILASGYLPEFLHDQGLLQGDSSLAALRDQSHILPRAKAALEQGLSGPRFSAALRAHP